VTTKIDSALLNLFVTVLVEAEVVPVVVQGSSHSRVPHQWLVVPDELHGVLQLPAVAAVVFEAGQVPAEVRSLLQETVAAQSILKVRINLNLLGELERLDLNEGSRDRLHVALGVAEGDPAGADGILVSVGVDASVDNSSKEIIEDVGETLSIEHPVQGSNKDRLLRVQPLTGTPHIVAVRQHPGDDLHLLAPHPPAGDPVVPRASTGVEVVSALGEQGSHSVLRVQDDVEISLGRRGRTSLAWPLDPDASEGFEGVDKTLLSDVPGDAAKEDLAAVEWVLVLPGRELARPGAGGIVQTGGIAVQLGGSVQAGGVTRGHQEHGVQLLPVREKRGSPHLTHSEVTGLGLARPVAEQRVEDVGRVGAVVGAGGLHLSVHLSPGAALHGVGHGGVQLRDGGKLGSGSTGHGSHQLGKVEVRGSTLATGPTGPVPTI